MTIRILIVDDHPVVRTGLRVLLSAERDMVVVGEASNGADAVTLHAACRPDVTLMDLRMAGLNGVTATAAILRAQPGARVIALTSYDGDADIHRALNAGACSYLIKDSLGREVVGAVRAAATDLRDIPPPGADRQTESGSHVQLTRRQVEVLRLVAKGLRNEEIARLIGRTEGTVKVHMRAIHAKLGVAGRTEAVTLGLRRGIIHLDD